MLALLPLLLSLAPTLADALIGPKAQEVTQAATDAVVKITGSDDPTAVKTALADPDKAAELRKELLLIAAQDAANSRQASLAMFQASTADTQNARAGMLALVHEQSPLQWAGPIVSVVTMVGFFVLLGVVLLHAIPTENSSLAVYAVGVMSAAATQVVNYWLGSSSGSAAKDGTIKAQSALLATSVPAPAIPITPNGGTP
jgi:hypothetical protein